MTHYPVEQAIFTSAETDQPSAYSVVSASRGIAEADIEELASWGPSWTALLKPAPESVSLSFHPLPSGAYCLGRTTPMLAPGSHGPGLQGAADLRLYTQNLIFSPSTFRRFGNHPLRLFHAALTQGVFGWMDEFPRHLETLNLRADETVTDAQLLRRLAKNPGPEWMAALMQTVLDNVVTAIIGGPPSVHVIGGLISCFPIECRPEVTFSTGLRFSTRRPFRVVGLCGDEEEQQRIERLYNMNVVDFTLPTPEIHDLFESLPQLVHRVMRAGDYDFLTKRAGRPTSDLSWEDLPALGLQWLEEFDRSVMIAAHPPGAAEQRRRDFTGWDEALASSFEELFDAELKDAAPVPSQGRAEEDIAETPSAETEETAESRTLLAHAEHRGPWVGSVSYTYAGVEVTELAPSRRLKQRYPDLLSKFEEMDRLVHAVLAGRSGATARLGSMWATLSEPLPSETVRDIAEEYAQFTLAHLNGLGDPASPRQPDIVVRALDMLTLFGE